MSGLKQQLNDDVKAAMRSKDSERLVTLRMITAAIKQKEVDERIELDDHQVIAILDKMARQHNDSNVLALGERLIAVETAKDSVNKFLSTEFEGGRHQRRVDKLSQIGKTTAN